MEFGLDKAQEVLDREIGEAEELIRNPSKVDEILMQLEDKLKAVPVIGSTLSDLPLMIAMVLALKLSEKELKAFSEWRAGRADGTVSL